MCWNGGAPSNIDYPRLEGIPAVEKQKGTSEVLSHVKRCTMPPSVSRRRILCLLNHRTTYRAFLIVKSCPIATKRSSTGKKLLKRREDVDEIRTGILSDRVFPRRWKNSIALYKKIKQPRLNVHSHSSSLSSSSSRPIQKKYFRPYLPIFEKLTRST